MKSVLKNLTLIGMGLMIYSCNEKISPELQSGSSTTIPTATLPDEYYFRLVNNSPVVLNYVLHRSGAGKAAAECKVSSNGVPLSSTLFTGQGAVPFDSKSYDIACYMEAEEWSLFTNGLSYKIEASKNTCEYIAYAPYSYFDAIPGSSSANYAGVKCTLPVTTSSVNLDLDSRAAALAIGATKDGVNSIPCGTMVDTSILPTTARTIRNIPTDMQSICAYDYSTNGGGGGQNCDTGVIGFNFINVIDGRLNPTDAMNPEAEPFDEPVHSCGGKTVACVEGAIKQISQLSNVTKSSIVQGSLLNQDYSKTYDLPALNAGEPRSAMHDIVNFRRGLASLHLNYADYSAGNVTQWSDVNYNKSFDPTLLEKFSLNRTPDDNLIIDVDNAGGASHVSNAAWIAKTKEAGYTKTPYAADSFLGTVPGLRVNPLYTFYCLDRAQEVKARIRMVVRDWDKVFPTGTTEMELISDVFKNSGSRRQDLPSDDDEIPNDPGQFNMLNDIDDWDVLVEMDRTDPNAVGIYDPGDTFWSPTEGWWDTSIFPNSGPPGAAPQ